MDKSLGLEVAGWRGRENVMASILEMLVDMLGEMWVILLTAGFQAGAVQEGAVQEGGLG